MDESKVVVRVRKRKPFPVEVPVIQFRAAPEGALMPLGTVRITPGAVAALERAGVRGADLLARHARGDWGKAGHYDRTRVSDTEMRKVERHGPAAGGQATRPTPEGGLSA
jgi:hypothetical protein